MLKSNIGGRGARGSRRLLVATALALTMALSLSATVASTAGAQSEKKILGKKNVAKGEPVKIGLVSNGRSANLDNQFEVYLADAMTEYLNTYRGGIGGRPIQLLQCQVNAQAAPVKAQECANDLISKGIVLMLAGSFEAVSAVHTATMGAGIPYFLYSITDPVVLTEPTKTFVLFDPRSGVYALPISVAKDNKLKLVTEVVVDIPAATELYTQDVAKQQFAEAKINQKLVPVPLGQADLTPQMAAITNGDPTSVQIIGNDTVCIAAFKGLQATGFTGPISTLFTCVNEATRTAVGSYLKGVYISVSTPLGDLKDPDYKLLSTIVKKYSSASEVPDLDKSLNLFAVYMSAWQAIAGMKGDINAATITSTIKAMPNMDVIGGGGLIYRCNGKAKPGLVAVCSSGGLRTTLNDQGLPTLPYEVVGNAKVPD